MPLDRVDLPGDMAEHGRGITGAAADLEHPIVRPDLGRFNHQRDNVRLRNGLTFLDRQRGVVVSVLAEPVRHEDLSRHRAHRLEQSRILHPSRRELPLHHPFALGGERRHDDER